jgi:hypothetical protein
MSAYIRHSTLARELGCCPRTVLRRIHSGELGGAVLIGQEYHIPSMVVEQWLRSRQATPGPVPEIVPAVFARNLGELRRKTEGKA